MGSTQQVREDGFSLSHLKSIHKLTILNLTLVMLSLLLSKAQFCKNILDLPKPCLVGNLWKALAVYFQMSTYVPGIPYFFPLFPSNFVLSK